MSNTASIRKQMSSENKSTNHSNKKKNGSMKETPTLSLLEAMEHVAEMAENSGLKDKFQEEVRAYSSFLADKLKLNEIQAILYSIMVDHYDDKQLNMRDIARHTDARLTRLARYQNELDVLEHRRLIRRSCCSAIGRNEDESYYVPSAAMKALREDKLYVPAVHHNVGINEFVRQMNEIVVNRYERHGLYDIMFEDMFDIVQGNKQLKIGSNLYKLYAEMSDEEWVLLCTLVATTTHHGGRLGISSIGKVLDEDNAQEFQQQAVDETLDIQKLGLVEFGFANGMVDRDCLQLSGKGKKMLLSEYKMKTDRCVSNNLISHAKIQEKALFYDCEVEKQVERLETLLKPRQFKEICKRMKQHGMRQGFACLFYGAPGTGKTETVLQLARKTGRSIMQVNISEIKDKYVGETEKNVKHIFEEYSEALHSEKVVPILLFNEADAIIGKRLEKVEHSVDSMNNAMQNIILQEMESFEGILIATTNLQSNMDSAFERRFLYKVNFCKPSTKVRKHIWQSIIKNLPDTVAEALAKEHDFSGGQIENIARKQIVDSILYGDKSDIYASLKEYCNNETLKGSRQMARIGF